MPHIQTVILLSEQNAQLRSENERLRATNAVLARQVERLERERSETRLRSGW
jgi:cell division protein FtsB